jgi:hypothetical protein
MRDLRLGLEFHLLGNPCLAPALRQPTIRDLPPDVARQGGRPRAGHYAPSRRGKSQRKPIPLPDGDTLVPYFTTFAEITGLHVKTLQRLRHKLPTRDLGGVAYVKDAEARRILAPAKPRRGRWR